MLKKTLLALLTLAVVGAAAAIVNVDRIRRGYFYPIRFEIPVTSFSEKNGLDMYLTCAVIKTESGFDEKAVSSVGARGLMQLTEEAFDWVKFRMGDERDLSYDDMFDPEYNIEYGTYLLRLLYEEYGDDATVMAAYHSGRSNVNGWLRDKNYSGDGKTLSSIPSRATGHYVDKVMTAYEAYKSLYAEK
jgi:soluble lytic murein transglycosylase